MASGLFFWCAAIFLVGPVAGYHCEQNCDSEGLIPEELPTTFISVEKVSHCAEPLSEVLEGALHCDDSSPGTGHLLYRELTEDVLAVERCYSFCFNSLTPTRGMRPDSEDLLNDSGKNCFQLEDSFVCFSACLFTRRLDGLKTAPSLYRLPANATCKDFCAAEGGICDRAFSPSADKMCDINCNGSLCTTMCDMLDQRFPTHSDPQGQSIPFPSGNLSLQLASSYELRKQGVLVLSSTDKNESAAKHGLVWKVTVNDSLEYYIPQHLPFHFLPMEVGPLYRVGSNMLSIRQLQCLPGVNLSYALVNAVGVSEFSEPQQQCFYGNGFLQPPSDLHVSIGFIPLSPQLRLTLEADTLSPDQEHVTGYEVTVHKDSSDPIVKLVFPDKENLSLIFEDEEVDKIFPSFDETYFLSFYALPQTNTTATGRIIRPAGNWLMVIPKIPDYPILNGTSCYSLMHDRREGLVNVTIQLSLHSGWKSLAPVASIRVEFSLQQPFTLELPFGLPPQRSFTSVKTVLETHAIEDVTQTNYTYKFQNQMPTSGEQIYKFTISVTPHTHFAGYPQNSPLETSTTFTVPALPPLPVRDLQVCYVVEGGSQAVLNVTWLPPEGKRDLTYQVIASRDGAVINTTQVNPTNLPGSPLSVNLIVLLPATNVHVTVLAMSSGVNGVPSAVTLNLASITSYISACVTAVGSSVNEDDVISVISTCPQAEMPQTEMPQTETLPNSSRRSTLTAAILCAVLFIQALATV